MTTSEKTLSIQVRLSYSDVLHALRLYRSVTSKEKPVRLISGFILLLLGGVYFLPTRLATITPNAIDITPLVSILSLLFGLIFIFDLFAIALSWVMFKRYLRQHPHPYQLVFDDSNIIMQTDNARAVYNWSYYQAVVEGKTVFILIYGKSLYSIIPKASFQDEAEIEVLRSLLKNNLPKLVQELRV
jgi:hypothetical protein